MEKIILIVALFFSFTTEEIPSEYPSNPESKEFNFEYQEKSRGVEGYINFDRGCNRC